MAERKLTGRATSMPQGLALGAAVSVIITILITAVGAHLIISEVIRQEHIGYCSIAAILLSTILGALTAAGRIKRRLLMVCMLSGASYFLILLAMTAMFFGGQYEGTGVTLLVILLGSFTAALIGNYKAGSTSKRLRKKTIR